MMTSRTRDTRPNHTTTGLAPWRLDHTRLSRQDIHSTRVPVRQGGCGWPDFTKDDKRQNETTAQTQDDSNTGVGSDKL